MEPMKTLLLHAGLVCLSALILEDAFIGYEQLQFRSKFLQISINVSRGLSLLVIGALLVFQLISLAILIIPALHLRTGVVVPSALLITISLVDAVLFGDFGIMIVMLRLASYALSLSMVAIFRYDRRARNAALQIPVASPLLTAETYVRSACSKLKCAFWAPIVSCVLIFIVVKNRHWRINGHHSEISREKFQLYTSLAATFFIQASQDNTKINLYKVVDFVHRVQRKYYPDTDLFDFRGKTKLI